MCKFKSIELNRDTCSRPLALPSLSRWIGSAQANVRSATHFCFLELYRLPLGNFLLTPNTICKTYKLPLCFRIELVQGIVIIKLIHPKLAHAFGFRLILSASVHSHT